MSDCSAARPSSGTGTLTIRPLRGRAGLMLAGEADITTRDALHAALAALKADGAGEVHLDLAGLRFIDVSCTRELIAITGRHPPARLIAHDPPPCLLRLTALIYPQAPITITGRPRPDTGAPPDAGPARDGGGSGPGGSPATGRPPRGGVTMPDAAGVITGDHVRIRRLRVALGTFARHREEMTDGPPPGSAVPRPEGWRSRGAIAAIARRWHPAGPSPRARTRPLHGS